MSLVLFLVKFRKPLLIGLAVTAVCYGVLAAYRAFRAAKQDKIVAELALHVQDSIATDMQARLAIGSVDRAQLAQALRAEKLLSGELRAALQITIPARDTILVERDAPTTALDGVRTATFHDSTFAGVITGTMVAPVYPEPLRIGYTVHRPAFSPTVAFVQVGDTMVAVVHWQGERAEIAAPFWKPTYHRRSLQGFAEVFYTTAGWEGKAGPLLNLGNHLQAEGWIGYAGEVTAGAGFRGVF